MPELPEVETVRRGIAAAGLTEPVVSSGAGSRCGRRYSLRGSPVPELPEVETVRRGIAAAGLTEVVSISRSQVKLRKALKLARESSAGTT